MFWFIVMQVANPGGSALPIDLSNWHFASHQQCMREAARRASGIRANGIHGRFMCMHPGEQVAEMDRRGFANF